MSVNSLVVPALVANVVVFCCLHADRVKIYVAGVRGLRQIQAFRVAGRWSIGVSYRSMSDTPSVVDRKLILVEHLTR